MHLDPEILFFCAVLAMVIGAAIVIGMPLRWPGAQSGPFRKQFVLFAYILMFLLGVYLLFIGISTSIGTIMLLLGV